MAAAMPPGPDPMIATRLREELFESIMLDV
jgi:hypothetical protein